jgi:15-cis-phytoene synthase
VSEGSSTAVGSDALLGCSALAEGALLARARSENFPVAPRWLPPGRRDDLLALYGFARLVDQSGDEAPGDRTALLDAVSLDLERAFSGAPQHPVLQRLARTIRQHALAREPFERLIEANRIDQRRARVASFEELMDYCTFSANPVGELVLRVFEQAGERNIRLSNAVCSALQVIEHCQDVAEDFRNGRVYLPADDLARAGCSDAELAGAPASPALRSVVALQIGRARALLADAGPLCAALHGLARWLVAGYAAGGLAACEAFDAVRYDPNRGLVRGRRRDLLWHALALGFTREVAVEP